MMTTPKNQTSARQAAARQRIEQRDSPAGSDPPDEQPNMKWTINPDNPAEKEILISMLAYLRDNPTVNNDLNVFRFIYRNWYTLECTLHTKATIHIIKQRLIALGIRYIHRTPDQQWHYWNDYTPPLAMLYAYKNRLPAYSVPEPRTGSAMLRDDDVLKIRARSIKPLSYSRDCIREPSR